MHKELYETATPCPIMNETMERKELAPICKILGGKGIAKLGTNKEENGEQS